MMPPFPPHPSPQMHKRERTCKDYIKVSWVGNVGGAYRWAGCGCDRGGACLMAGVGKLVGGVWEGGGVAGGAGPAIGRGFAGGGRWAGPGCAQGWGLW